MKMSSTKSPEEKVERVLHNLKVQNSKFVKIKPKP